MIEAVKSKITDLDKAFDFVRNGGNMVTGMAAAEPYLFYNHLGDCSETIKSKLRIYCANPSQRFPIFVESKYSEILEFVVMFMTRSVRQGSVPSHVQYLPQHLSQWSKMICSRSEVDVFWGTCSLPDARGFVSLGTGACYETEILRKAKHVILEINPNMPRTQGSTLVSLDEVSCFLETDHVLPAIGRPAMTTIDHQIAQYVADLIPNRATLQLGIGSIPNAIGEALSDHRDLGIHTEMVNDTMMDLYQKGIVTGAYKSRWPRKIIGSFAFGTSELYRFLDENPIVELHPASIVNDSYRLGLNHLMTSVNSALEIDLTGQVCSESLGHLELSGIGGASETHIGAQRSEGGQGIIAIPSTTRDKRFSKIVFELRPGAKVSISRNDIDTVVSEYGVAKLKGKTVSERVAAMIAIAAPEFRDELAFQAKQANYI